MKSHASMNRIYRLVWNAALGLWVAVAENAKGRSKGGSSRSRVAFSSLASLLTALALLAPPWQLTYAASVVLHSV